MHDIFARRIAEPNKCGKTRAMAYAHIVGVGEIGVAFCRNITGQ